jgi:uncharacterized protein YjiS (DUF1127 family)
MSSSTIAPRPLPAKHPGSTVPPWHAAPVQAIKRLIARIRNERRIRRAVDELKALDDRTLADIGVTRGDVEHAVRYGTFPVRER